MNVLRGTLLTPFNYNLTERGKTRRQCFDEIVNEATGFVYNSMEGRSSKVPLPTDASVTGFRRNATWDFYWPNSNPKPGMIH